MKRDTKQIGTKKVKCFGKKRPKPDLKNTKKPKTIRSQKQAQKHQKFKNVCSKKQKQGQKRKHVKNICTEKTSSKTQKKTKNDF